MADSPSDVPDGVTDALALHGSDSTVRNLCLVWPDGHKAFFNYAYLVAGDLTISDSLNVIVLYFSGQIVTLKGYQLGLLFDLLVKHLPKTITATDPRYCNVAETKTASVIEILIKTE